MAPRNKVFVIGPGFIGGEVIDVLVREGYDVTALIRREAAAVSLKESGVKIVQGELDHKDTIARAVTQSDIVFHCATADHLPSVEAVLDGISKRAEEGKNTIFIHTSGASLLGDDSGGSFQGEKVFHDDKPEDINALPDSSHHREIDLSIIRAREGLRSTAKLAIMIPPLIYGVSTREQRLSIQLPTLTRFALKHGFAGHVGRGLSVWSQVHVKDLARAYVLLLHWLEQDHGSEVFTNPYFFCENGEELSWGDCSAEIGKALHKAGLLESAQARTIPEDLYSSVFGPYTGLVVGSNSRCRANRLRSLGWKPQEKGTLESLREDEIPIILSKQD